MHKNRIVILAILMFLVSIMPSHGETQSYFETVNPMKVIDPAEAAFITGIRGTVNVIRVIVPASHIEESEYDIRVTFRLNSRHEANIESEIPAGRSSAFSNAYKMIDEPSRHVYRFDLLANGNDGIIDFIIKDLRLPSDFDDWKVSVDIDVEGSKLLTDTTLDFANTTRIDYQVTGGYRVLPLSSAMQEVAVSAGAFTFTQTQPGKPANLKMELPRGFYWDPSVDSVWVMPLNGFNTTTMQEVTVKYENVDSAGRTARGLEFQFSELKDAREFERSSWEVLGSYPETGVKILADAGNAVFGSVNVRMSNATPVEMPIALYRQPRVVLEKNEASIIQWSEKVAINGFTLEERSLRELQPGDVLSLTLPSGVSWDAVEDNDGTRPVSTPQLTSGTEANQLQFEGSTSRIRWHFADTEQRTIYTTVTQQSSSPFLNEPARLVFSGGTVILERTFDGSLDVAVAGSAAGRGLVYPAAIIENAPGEETEDNDELQIPDSSTKAFRLPIYSGFYTEDGTMKPYRVTPFIHDNRTFMGLRDVSEMMGIAEEDIIWDPVTSSVTIRHEGQQVLVRAGSPIISVGQETIEMDTTPVIRDGRIMLPISPLMRLFGIEYTWEQSTNTVIFTR